jgi:phosphoserine phosphatase RsbU/P
LNTTTLPKILLAEDDVTTRLVISQLLEKNGYHVMTACDGLEAVGMLEQTIPDVILTDLNMPNLDGIEVVRIVKSLPEFTDIPVLVLTAEDNQNTLRKLFDLGAIDYIRKPIAEVELVARLAAVVRLKLETDKRKQKERELNDSLQSLKRDLQAAGDIQRAMLPKTNVMIAGIELAWHFRPSEAVGGDLLNFIPLNEHQVAFYLMDVSGHGVPSALFAVSIHSMLIQNTRPGGLLIDHEGQARRPHDVVTELNSVFQMDLDSQKYFTFTYAVLDTYARTIDYTQAGQTPALHLNGKTCEYWDEGDMPVGMMPNVQFKTYSRKIEPGSRIYLYSDGIVEAFGKDGDQFGYKRLSETIFQYSDKTLTESIRAVINDVDQWIDKNIEQDDITVLGVELVPDFKTARVTVVANAEAVRTLCATVRDVVLQVSNNLEVATWIEMAIAEAGNNIVQHGYGDNGTGEIRLEARATGEMVEVSLIDFAAPYNPLEAEVDFESWDYTNADEISAGLGLGIMRAMMDDASYERVDNSNRLTMRRSL